jgi:hypothetical protein
MENKKVTGFWPVAFFVFGTPMRALNPGFNLLGINASSVSSAGKRSTGPFSISAAPHLPHLLIV